MNFYIAVQWLEENNQSLCMESQESEESLHDRWEILLESWGEVKDKASDAHNKEQDLNRASENLKLAGN